MRVVSTMVAVLWMAVVTGRAKGDPLNRCSPALFEVDPDPGDYQFRAEQAHWIGSCDTVTMTEIQANAGINTVTVGNNQMCNSETHLMTDLNWEAPSFQPNVASAFYLPPVAGCRWELYLVKQFDPIVGNNNCQCDNEDHVHFKDDDNNERKYCDFTHPLGDDIVGWCAAAGDNVYVQPAFVTDVNTGVLTTFRSDNCNGDGQGGFVFAYTVPLAIGRRSVHQSELPSEEAPSQWLKAYCWKYNTLCINRRCKNYPCECYTNTSQRITCTLYAIFTDATGRTAVQNSRSCENVIRWAARHALSNIGRFGRPVPTYTQLQQNTTTTPTPTCTSCPRTDPTKSTPKTTSSTTLRPTPRPPKWPIIVHHVPRNRTRG